MTTNLNSLLYSKVKNDGLEEGYHLNPPAPDLGDREERMSLQGGDGVSQGHKKEEETLNEEAEEIESQG